MFTDVYNRRKNFKPFSSSLFRCVTGSEKKGTFGQMFDHVGNREFWFLYMGRFQFRESSFNMTRGVVG